MAPESSITLSIGAHSYYILRDPKATLPSYLLKKLYVHHTDYIPTTAIDWQQETFSKHDLENTCGDYERKDDVWSRDFLSRKSNLSWNFIAKF